MTAIVSTLLVGVLSALVPLVNIEAYLAVAAAEVSTPAVLLAAVGAVGQMVGKLLWYQAGVSSARVPWLGRKMQQPKWKARLEKWRARTAGRPFFTGVLLFVSAFIGFPPYAVIAALAGVLRANLVVFLVTGLVGRFLRFWAVLATAGAALRFFS